MKVEELGFLGVIFGVAGVGYSVYTNRRVKKVMMVLDTTIDEVASKTNIDIPGKLIEDAVDRAVDREARKAVSIATSKAVNDIERDIHKQVKESVDKSYSDTNEAVSKELTKLDDILEKFNSDLDHVSTIYSSIASKMAEKSDSKKEMVFKVG